MRAALSNPALSLVPALLLVAAVGCASHKMVRLEVQTEGVSSHSISVGDIRTYAVEGEVFVAGSLFPRTGGVHHAPPGHIDITALDGSSNVLIHAKTSYSPRPIEHKPRGRVERSSFTARLPVAPENLASVRVSHHPIRLSECSYLLF